MRARAGADGWLGTGLLFAVAVGLRCAGWWQVFAEGRVQLASLDAYYHLRRMFFTARRFPASLDFDPYLNFPVGGEPIWSAPFDWLGGAWLLAVGGAASPERAEGLLVWIPPLLGGAAVASLHRGLRARLGEGAAWVGALWLAVLPLHVWYSQLSFVDHHVAVAWASLAVFGVGLGQIEATAAGRRLGALRRGLHGVALGGALWLWPGCLLHVAGVAIAGFALQASRADRAAARGLCLDLAATWAVAALVVAPAAWGREWSRFGPFSPVVLTGFQPWFCALLALFHGGCAGLFAGAAGAGQGRRLAVSGGLGLLLLVLSAGVFGIAGGLEEAFAWLAKTESFQARVSESRSLLRFGGREGASFSPVLALLSGLAPAAPVMVALAWREARGPVERAAAGWVGAWALVWLGAALLQTRFGNTASVALALLAGVSFEALRRAFGRRLAPVQATLASVAFLGLLALPLAGPLARAGARGWASLGGEPGPVAASAQRTAAGLDVAGWLAANSPTTAGWLDPAVAPEWGILPDLNLGHLLVWAARRPTWVGNFGDDLDAESYALARRVWRMPAAEALPVLDARRIRYLVVPGEPLGEGPRAGPEALARRLQRAPAAPSAGRGAPLDVPGLRLVFESRGWAGAGPRSAPIYRVFERVPGAVLEGRAEPGEEVEATLRLVGARGRPLRFRTRARADAAGRVRLGLPYGTAGRGGPPGIAPAEAYEIRCGRDRVLAGRLPLDEATLGAGGRIQAPPCPVFPDAAPP